MNPMPQTSDAMTPVDYRPALVEVVVTQMTERILSGAFPASAPLPSEGQLAESLGVSRTVIREAMRSLRTQGLVEVSQGKRPRVRLPDPASASQPLEMLLRRTNCSPMQLFEVRRVLEGEIAALAALRANDEQCREMEKTFELQLNSKTMQACIDADSRFHELLARATGNELFCVLLMVFDKPLRESRERTISQTGPQRAVESHRAILREVRLRNAEGARREMLEHLRRSQLDLDGWFQNQEIPKTVPQS